ncbi:hemerythrin domain-containing protein [Bdellovibrio sp. NC01]|uniref:hemerythrin domain-containing protein n=1 Tax=Bdellovibrio sp. NC01 TaxID=2220073 RepID=UPI00115AC390|nr:hemerythrin domain-containing protein [Bdellovibrio sp. NC01]QDK38425.1 hypothetical protein DOE51_12985 [Bdellovibrio sp. NC01]
MKKTAKKSKAATAKSKVQRKKAPMKMASGRTGKAVDKEGDIINLILEDHRSLKELIKVMKDTDNDMEQRQQAFDDFAPLLVLHAKPEEQTLYVECKQDEELRTEGFEGDVEHQLADQMLEEIERTEDEDLWSARVKVLAELVEHHIQEEEGELLPDFRDHSELEDRVELGKRFIELKERYLALGGTDSPSEVELEEEEHHHHPGH